MSVQKKIGVADVAKYAGVSIGTVSNYINYPERVSRFLQVRIQEAIDTLGYIPKSTKTTAAYTSQHTAQPTPIIGYVMTDIEHSLFTEIFEGIQEVCEDSDMQVIGVNASSDMDRQHNLVQMLIDMHVTGILLSTIGDPTDDIEAAAKADIPLILIDHTCPQSSAHQVCAILENNVSTGFMAAQELLSIKCSSIAFVAHSFEYEQILDRQLGAEKALRTAGYAKPLHIYDSDGITAEDGYQLGLELLESAQADTPLPDGIIAATDQLGIGLMKCLLEHTSMKIPEDIAIIGCEGVNLASSNSMPLSVIHGPGVDMGRKAMLQLLDYLDPNTTHIHSTVLIEPTLIRRQSTMR